MSEALESAPAELPERSLALRSLVTAETVEVSVVEVEVPRPRPDQVVIRVEAAPVNPSDLNVVFAGSDLTRASWHTANGHPALSAPLGRDRRPERAGRALPCGNEGAGTVVAAGADEPARALLGRIVAASGGGFYGRYRCLDASACLVLPEGATAVDGAASFVNPMTVLCMLETMRAEGHSAIVHTAAASSLGQMLVRVCREDGVALVNVVRSPESAQRLRDLGAEHVCNSSSESFAAELTDACAQTGATIGFDATGGGALAGRVLHAMEQALRRREPTGAYGTEIHKQVYLYGGLDPSPTTLTRSYGMSWGVGGWLVTPALRRAGAQRSAELRARVARELATTFATDFAERVGLTEMLSRDAVDAYRTPSTGGKFLVLPQE